MTGSKVKTREELKIMADALEEVQLSFESVKNKALDQKVFYTGYSQCAEEMIKIMTSRMIELREQAKKPEEEEFVEIKSTEKENDSKLEAPLIVDPEKKGGRKK